MDQALLFLPLLAWLILQAVPRVENLATVLRFVLAVEESSKFALDLSKVDFVSFSPHFAGSNVLIQCMFTTTHLLNDWFSLVPELNNFCSLNDSQLWLD